MLFPKHWNREREFRFDKECKERILEYAGGMFGWASFPKITIAEPCHEDWAAMSGDEKSRFCNACRKSVVNFGQLTPRQARSVLRESNNQICARISHDSSGKIRLRQERLNGLADRLVQLSLLGASAVAAHAQTCTLEIRVKDPVGMPIPGAPVNIANLGGAGTTVSGKTDESGAFATAQPSGTYGLEVTMPGFRKYANDDLFLQCSASYSATLEVQLDLGRAHSDLTVSADAQDFTTMGVVASYRRMNPFHAAWHRVKNLVRRMGR